MVTARPSPPNPARELEPPGDGPDRLAELRRPCRLHAERVRQELRRRRWSVRDLYDEITWLARAQQYQSWWASPLSYARLCALLGGYAGLTGCTARWADALQIASALGIPVSAVGAQEEPASPATTDDRVDRESP